MRLVFVWAKNIECDDINSYRQYTGKKQYNPWMGRQNFIQHSIKGLADWLCETYENGQQTYNFTDLAGRGHRLNVGEEPYVKEAG